MDLGEMFKAYYKEELDLEVLHTEDGFITYKANGEEMFIQDVFTDPTKRKNGTGRALLKEVEKLAAKKQCTHVSGLCLKNRDYHDNKKFTAKVATMIAVGFDICEVNSNGVVITKYLPEV